MRRNPPSPLYAGSSALGKGHGVGRRAVRASLIDISLHGPRFQQILPNPTVRRAKALAPSGCEARPANCRSSRKPSERVMEVTTWTEALRRKGPPFGWLSEHAGRNASKRRAGLEKHNAEADPPLFRGRQPASGKRATRAPGVSAGVLAAACVQEGDRGNMGSPGGGAHAPTGIPRGAGWRRGP